MDTVTDSNPVQLEYITQQLSAIHTELSELRRESQRQSTQQKRTAATLGGVADDVAWAGLGIDLTQIGIMFGVVVVIELAIAVGDAAPGWLKSAVSNALGQDKTEQVDYMGSGQGQSSSTGDAVAAAALKWVGREFKPGVQAQCAFFVRAVLKEAGVTMGVAPLSWDGLRGGGEGLAAAFFSDDLGQRIDPGAVRPGDLVAFTNTYGNFEQGAITHVGIVVNKDGVMAIVDRPTSSAPVKFRPLDSLPWPIAYAIRPAGYKTTQSGSSGDHIARIRMAITNQESNGNCQALNASGSGATGLGQVMPENIGPWTQAALGRSYTQAEFLADCEAQIRTLDHKIGEYYQAAIARGADERTAVMQVAAQWYSGDPAKYTSETPQYWNGNSYPSIASYSREVLAKVEMY